MGCTQVGPACDHCYAEAQEDARYGRVEWGGPRRRTSEATRRAPYRWDREAAAAGERRRVFCMSLGDFWDNQVPDEWRMLGGWRFAVGIGRMLGLIGMHLITNRTCEHAARSRGQTKNHPGDPPQ